jgi:DNA helicase HerA-like ATPase
MLLQRYRDDQAEAKKPWTLKDFCRWLPPNAKACGEILDVEVHAHTYAGMRSRLQRPARIPGWIDGALTPAARQGLNIGHFALENEVGPGKITVIRIDNSVNSGRSYGLFLSYILDMAWNLRAGRKVRCPILHVIDEAQDIFDAGSTFKNAVGNMLDAQIRRGRSKRVGFVIAAQSAGAVPEEIRNLTNSRFIHRHKNSQQAREALEQASPAQLAMIDTFAAGECLAEINGAHALVHVQMRPSPFQLTKDDE